jgi:hypothetical protein
MAMMGHRPFSGGYFCPIFAKIQLPLHGTDIRRAARRPVAWNIDL